jgi:putative ABC transport system substrate-binding protein
MKRREFITGQNVRIEYRWADGHYDRLPALATELVRRRVAVLVAAGGEPAALAAEAATKTIPIVFSVSGDPVKFGLVSSLNRSGGNATGVTNFGSEVVAKRLQLLREFLPSPGLVAVLVDSNYTATAFEMEEVNAAAAILGLRTMVLNVAEEGDLPDAFALVLRERAQALLVQASPLFTAARTTLAILAARHSVPAIYGRSEIVKAGGLMSYGSRLGDQYR